MSKLTQKAVIEASNIPPLLVRAVSRQIGGWTELCERAEDIVNYGADGGVSGFIAYSDTVAFAKRHKGLILEHLTEFCQDCGYESIVSCLKEWRCLKGLSTFEIEQGLYNSKSGDRAAVYNALAWYALEEVARVVVDCLENEG